MLATLTLQVVKTPTDRMRPAGYRWPTSDLQTNKITNLVLNDLIEEEGEGREEKLVLEGKTSDQMRCKQKVIGHKQ